MRQLFDRNGRKGQVTGVDSLIPLAVAIVSIAVIVGVGVVVLGEMTGLDAGAQVNTTNHEPHQPTATNGINTSEGFQQFDVLDSDADEFGSITVDFQNTGTGTNTTLTRADPGTSMDQFYNYTSSYPQVNITKVDRYDSSTESKFYVTYDAETFAADSVLNKGVSALDTFAQFFVVIIIVGIAVVIFILLRGVRLSARRSSV